MSPSTVAATLVSILLHAAFFWIRPSAPEKIATPPAQTIRIQIAAATASTPPKKRVEAPISRVEKKAIPPKEKPKRNPPLPEPIPVKEVEPDAPPEEMPALQEPLVAITPVEEVPAVEVAEALPVSEEPTVADVEPVSEIEPLPMQPIHLTPSPGMPDDGLGPFRKALLKQIAGHRLYPKRARDRGIEGMVYVQFTIDPKGRVHEVEILPPAEAHPLLVQAAMETIRKASPLPPVPDFLRGQDRIVIILGMRFELK